MGALGYQCVPVHMAAKGTQLELDGEDSILHFVFPKRCVLHAFIPGCPPWLFGVEALDRLAVVLVYQLVRDVLDVLEPEPDTGLVYDQPILGPEPK